ncbi:MAG: hypothetical protein IKC46_05195 [Lachnospiraceae bacterium]|nr:hypothetical protein [Lachnospiraceae bacterium]
MKLTWENKMMVAGHRGDCYNWPENTMEGFRAAIEAGADMIETDVRLTKDNVLILMHDDKVDRTADGSGFVKEKTFAEMRRLNVGERSNPMQVPTLEELLVLLKEKDVLLNLEIKEYYSAENVDRCHLCIDECVKLIEKYDFSKKMLFNSFDAHVLEYIHKKYGGRYLLHGFYPYSIMHNVEGNPDEYLYCACIFDDRNKLLYEELNAKGIEPWIGAGVTRKTHLKECFEMGAKLVTTNNTADCIAKLDGVGAR